MYQPLRLRFKREAVSFATVLVTLGLYIPLMDESWSLYLALCAGYTVLVFGLIWSDGKWGRCLGGGKWTLGKLLQGHASFLLALIFWVWLARFSRPWLPDWLMNEGVDHLTLYLIFAALGIVAIWWIEQSWISKGSKKDEGG